MTRRTKAILRRVLPYVLVSVIAVGLLVAALIWPKKTSESETAAAQTEEVSTGDETEEGELPTVAAVEAVKVNELLNEYYQAKIDNDADTLNSIVDAETEYESEELADESQYIEKYDNFTTFVVPGITDSYYIVYVKYDIYFSGIETGAAALNRYIICRDDDGYYYIYDKELSGEFQTYVEQTENSATVQKIKKQVEDELQAACDSDPDLKYLIEVLNGEQDTSAAEETADTEAISESTEEVTAPADTEASAETTETAASE